MAINVLCPNCYNRSILPGQVITGQQVRCPHCRKFFSVAANAGQPKHGSATGTAGSRMYRSPLLQNSMAFSAEEVLTSIKWGVSTMVLILSVAGVLLGGRAIVYSYSATSPDTLARQTEEMQKDELEQKDKLKLTERRIEPLATDSSFNSNRTLLSPSERKLATRNRNNQQRQQSQRPATNSSDNQTSAAEERARRAEQKRIRAEAERIAKETENQKRRLELEAKTAIQQADYRGVPRPGESNYDWALRVLGSRSMHRGKVIKALAKIEINELYRDQISQRLIQYLETYRGNNFEVTLKAMMRWRTSELEREIIELVNLNSIRGQAELLMAALAEINTPASAAALATGITDDQNRDKATEYLLAMEGEAEEAVLKYLDHEDLRVRREVYLILSEIGTEKSVEGLQINVEREPKGLLKTKARKALQDIISRTNSQLMEAGS